MAWLFVRLKWQISGRSSGSSVVAVIWRVAVWLIGIVAGLIGGGLGLAGLRFIPDPRVTAATFGGLLMVIWILIPIIASTLDETLTAPDFELLPVSSGRLSRGLLLAAMAGPGGLATFIACLVAYGGGLWPGPEGLLTVPLLGLLTVLLCIAAGRIASAALDAFLSEASARVIVILLIAGVSLLVSVGAILAADGPGGIEVDSNGIGALPSDLAWLAVLPSGAVAMANWHLAEGSYLAAGALVLWGAVAALGAVVVHGWLLQRRQVRTTRTRRIADRSAEAMLGSGFGRWIESRPVTAAAGKEFRYIQRDPRLYGQLLGGGLTTLVVLAVTARSLFDTTYAPFFAVIASWSVIAVTVPNQFGVDAKSFWAYVSSPTNVSAALLGKNVVWALVTAPVVLAAGVFASLLSGSWAYLPAAIVAAAAVFVIWLTAGNITSIFGAFPLPEKRTFASSGGSAKAVVVSLAGLAVSGALTGPAAIVTGLAVYFGGPWWGLLGAIGGLVYAAFIFRVGIVFARDLVVRQRFSLLAVLDRD